MVKNTLTVGRIEEGFVLDHIQAGRSMDIYKHLHLDKLDYCVAIIKNSEIVDKKTLHLPRKITNVIRCKNPRCITSIEQELDHVFVLTDPENEVYRCMYCEEKYDGRRRRK